MPRDSYYQDVGNPIRRDLLPARPLSVSFPAPEAQSLARALAAFRVIGSILAMDILDSVVRLQSSSEDFSSARALAVFLVSLTVIVICVRLIRNPVARIGYFAIGVMSSLVATLALLSGVNNRLLWIHAGVIAMAYIWLFTKHWTERCTASPIDRQTAKELRIRWRQMVALRTPLPLLAVVVAIALPNPTAPMSIAVLTVVSVLLLTLSFQPGARAAFDSWFTYNISDKDAPGVLKCPVGGFGVRAVVIVASCFVIATCMRDSFPSPFILPSLVALALPSVFVNSVLEEANEYRRDGVTPDRWQTNVTSLRTSSNPIERESYYIASVLSDNSPVLLPRGGLIHGHFLGDTGGGKTSLGLLPFIEQTIGFGDASVVVIDLKADKLELMATMVSAAERLQTEKGIELPLKYLSTRGDYSCFALNPMTQPFWSNLTSYQRTDLLTAAAGLQYGTEYGEAFYDSTNAAVINETFMRFPDVKTFRELAEKCNQVVTSAARGGLHAEVRKNGIHALEVLKRLGSFPPINVSEDGGFPEDVLDQAIDLADVFRQPQMMYFHLNSTLSPGAAPALARFVTFFLLAAANTVERNAPVYLVIDEFQRMAASNFEYMLQLARSMDVHIILANQSMEDLKNSKTDLIPTIEANCGFRQWFSVTSSEDRRRLIESSGLTVDYFTSSGVSNSDRGSSTTTTVTEQLLPRISANDIALMSDHMQHSIVNIARGSGYARYGGLPFLCKSDFHISKDEYDQRQQMPWPSHRQGTFIPNEWNDRQDEPSTPETGPSITTEVLGEGNSDDPFSNFLDALETEEEPKKKQKKRRKRNRARNQEKESQENEGRANDE